jgi:acyl-coenzyme A synthetase/AMP-(fatty) acid ligase
VQSGYRIVECYAKTSTIGWHNRTPISAGRFCAAALTLAATLPRKRHVLNLCEDRLSFALGLAAALLARQVSLLPPSRAPDVVRDILASHPESYCLADHGDLPERVPAQIIAPWSTTHREQAAASIPADQLAVILFTSGSTGRPQPHVKTWRSLVTGGRNLGHELDLQPRAERCLLGTVPAQHMYGLEATIMFALQNGMAIHPGRPLLAADVAAALAQARMPTWLVTTPAHLRSWVGGDIMLSGVEGVLSATMPLPAELALQAEELCSAPLHEIYGSTETGAIALRRPASQATWRARAGMRLWQKGEDAWIEGGHLARPVALPDRVRLASECEFSLVGRPDDMVKVAGKRASLEALNRELQRIPGITDGTFFIPESAPRGSTRLSALVVAPALTARAITAALRQRIDPVFLPRPLLIVDALPRNATGKLPREGLLALARAARTQRRRSA